MENAVYATKRGVINDVMNNVKTLLTLGLSKYEAKVYLALFELKRAPALKISKQAGVKRPTTYQALEQLKKKGLVKSKTFRNVKDYQIQSLGALKKYVKKQKRLLQTSVSKMDELYQKRPQKLRTRVYDNIASVKTLLEKSLCEKSRMYIFGDEKNMESNLGPYWQFYSKRSSQLAIRPRFKSTGQSVTCLIWGNKVAFIRFKDPVQVFGFRNKKLADFYIHLWKRC